MAPTIDPATFVFCTVPSKGGLPAGVSPRLAFEEAEGLTLVLRQEEAERLKIPHSFPSKMLKIAVHSSLEAVGFLAAMTSALAARGISSNVVSAYYHDYIFVPEVRADEALGILRDLSHSAREGGHQPLGRTRLDVSDMPI
jgi:hypothetical protein